MKKFSFFSVLAITVILLSSIDSFFGNDPVLPSTPYTYTFPMLPSHLDTLGYGVVEDTILTFINDEVATLGRVLFYDELLSTSEDISCGTCHLQEFSFADSLTFSHGVSTNTARNSLQLNDLGWSNNSTFFWDMKLSSSQGPFDTLLSSAIQLPLADPNEIGVLDVNAMIQKMQATTYYPGLFSDAYGSSTITEPLILEALTHFISSMVTFDTKFDQSFDPGSGVTLTVEEENGRAIFQTDCQICHADGLGFLSAGGPLQAPMPFLYDNGMKRDSADRGAGEWMTGGNFDWMYKIPTLRNIELTGPYMHDGRFVTLDEVIEHYSDSIVSTSQWIGSPGFQYTNTEKERIVGIPQNINLIRIINTRQVVGSIPRAFYGIGGI